MTIEHSPTPQDLPNGERKLTFDSLEEALVALHGVPPEAAKAAVENMGSVVNYETTQEGERKIQLPKESFFSRIKGLLPGRE